MEQRLSLARPAAKPRISVIIAITHREVLAQAVAALARQTLPGSEFEVIIADGLLSDDWGARLPEVIRATGRVLDYSFHMAERRQSMRWAGQAAAILERKYPGPHPWQTEGRIPPWRHRAAALRARAAYFLTGRSEHREQYYRRTIAADFARGYRSAAPGLTGR